MCFYNFNRDFSKIAKENIICYKFLREDNRPPYMNLERGPYIKDKLNRKVRMAKTNPFTISIGYHSYKTKNGARHGIAEFLSSTKCIIRKFTIPSGARYFENKTQYVSETIILIE